MFHGTSSFKEQTSASALRRLLQVSLLTIPDFSAKKTPPDTVLSAAHLLEVMKLGLPGLTLRVSFYSHVFMLLFAFCFEPQLIGNAVPFRWHEARNFWKKSRVFQCNPSELLQCLQHPSGRQQPSSELWCSSRMRCGG